MWKNLKDVSTDSTIRHLLVSLIVWKAALKLANVSQNVHSVVHALMMSHAMQSFIIGTNFEIP